MKPTLESNAARMRWSRPFTWSGWLLVLVVLLSALPSAAQPRSRITGSAFDPAAVSVALKVKAHEHVKAKGSEQGPNLPEQHAGCDRAPAFDPAAPCAVVGGAESGRAIDFAGSARPMKGPLGQRAPPAG